MIVLYHSLPIVSGSIKVVRTSVTVSIVVALRIIGFRGGLTMINQAIFVLASVAAIGCGLVAGIFFAFSSFVMAALGRLPSDHGIAAMNSINVTVINPVFFTAFFGTALLSLVLAVGSWLWWDQASGKLLLAAAVIYLVGSIAVTMVYNVPLNNALAAVQPGTAEATNLWSRYLRDWTMWNTVRTVASVVSMILFILALIGRQVSDQA